eukprot:COSAG05_NODE_333_length_11249_cov_629.633094_6_plen_78_part_00
MRGGTVIGDTRRYIGMLKPVKISHSQCRRSKFAAVASVLQALEYMTCYRGTCLRILSLQVRLSQLPAGVERALPLLS